MTDPTPPAAKDAEPQPAKPAEPSPPPMAEDAEPAVPTPDTMTVPSNQTRAALARQQLFLPGKPPKTISETGLSDAYLINLVCKVMHSGGTMTPAEIADVVKLPKLVCRQLIKLMTEKMLVEAQGLETSDIKSDIRYSLTDLGKKWALDAMMVSQYVGPAPVTLKVFEEQIRRQSINHEEVHRSELDAGFSHLVIPDILKAQLGPAVNSGRSMLLYGEPGNGKTSLAEALGGTFVDVISFPYAILVGNQVIRFHDDTLHETADLPPGIDPIDPRWVPCNRPVVIAGGELTLDMLDLRFEQTARFYEAPMHLKALGGIFVLDDFGRQVEVPQAYLNRWIVPLEKGFDILSLHTGKKFSVPFDQLVVFSSNMLPEEMGDDAALRRIYFKIHVPSPTREDYLKIFRDVCDAQGIDWNAEVMDAFFQRKYEEGGFVTSGAHPGFLVQHIFAACRYLEREPELSMELLDLAWRNVAASKKRSIRA
ncbi:ATPase [Maribius pontilimi]|uniref:ATPase n=1 Tax=Palleronia pontilimi TaxID=1964209 RepID=A0A934IIP6_9RHOB|nr:ATPase [Palleronia pontilimi]MBJ3763648.1 ATPase [Palleronia pontilimi]